MRVALGYWGVSPMSDLSGTAGEGSPVSTDQSTSMGVI